MSYLKNNPNQTTLFPKKKTGGWLLYALLIFSVLLSVSVNSLAAPANIIVLSSGKAPVYENISKALQHRLDKLCKESSADCLSQKIYTLPYTKNDSSLVIPVNTKLIITLGLKAAELIQSMNTGLPVVHALIPKASVNLLEHPINHTTVYLDQPVSRQLALARLIKKEPHIGLLISPNTQSISKDLLSIASRQDLPISYRQIPNEDTVGPQLKELLEESNILLALPDPAVFNQRTIFNILLSSYHNKVPVIGFSSAYVKAGALIAVYSTPDDIAQHLAEFTFNYMQRGFTNLPRFEYPKYFSISVNQSVARSLGITLPAEETLIKLISDETKP